MELSKYQHGRLPPNALHLARLTDRHSEVAYADMNDGSWAIVIQSQENDFVTQREFDLVAGGQATAVIVTVRTPISAQL